MPFMNDRQRNLQNQSFQMQMSYAAGVLTTSNVAVTTAGIQFQLSSFTLQSALTSVFDHFRIRELEVWITPTCSMSTAAAPEAGVWSSVIDLDDATAPASAGAVECKVGAITSPALVAHYHRWTPQAATAVYQGAFTGYAQAGPVWIDCANPNVQHYGLKLASGITTTVLNYNMMVRATVEFRGIKG
jgi:hypothetical protein